MHRARGVIEKISTIPLLVTVKPAFGVAFSSGVKLNRINYTNYLGYNELNFFYNSYAY